MAEARSQSAARAALPQVGAKYLWIPSGRDDVREEVEVVEVNWNGEEWWVVTRSESGTYPNELGRFIEATVLLSPPEEDDDEHASHSANQRTQLAEAAHNLADEFIEFIKAAKAIPSSPLFDNVSEGLEPGTPTQRAALCTVDWVLQVATAAGAVVDEVRLRLPDGTRFRGDGSGLEMLPERDEETLEERVSRLERLSSELVEALGAGPKILQVRQSRAETEGVGGCRPVTKRFLVSPVIAEELPPELRFWVVVSPFVPDDAAFIIKDEPAPYTFGDPQGLALDDNRRFRAEVADWELARFHAAERRLGSRYRRLRRRVRRLVKSWLARVGIHLPAGWAAPRPRLAAPAKRRDFFVRYPLPAARPDHGIILECA